MLLKIATILFILTQPQQPAPPPHILLAPPTLPNTPATLAPIWCFYRVLSIDNGDLVVRLECRGAMA